MRILAIRLQATGDVVITLPYLSSLKKRHPEAAIDFLTREEAAPIPRSLELFSRVEALGGGRSFKLQCLSALAVLPRLLSRRYDAVLDLQNNELSRAVVRLLGAPVSSRFDKESPIPAGERTRRAIEESGLGPVDIDCDFTLKSGSESAAEKLLVGAGFRNHHRLVVLNPAGCFPSRNWPLASYVDFAREWQAMDSRPAQFLLIGLRSMRERTAPLRAALGASLLDLIGHTTPDEAFALVRRADLVLSEDSGLMHMAWVSGVPTLALFGSSRGDWSRPLGARSLLLDSSDLDCRFCMEAECRYGDVRCLTRRRPREVAELAFRLVDEARGSG
jgi:lipopolysaccharide heptosyltransferase II